MAKARGKRGGNECGRLLRSTERILTFGLRFYGRSVVRTKQRVNSLHVTVSRLVPYATVGVPTSD